jgi:hypothetical protein
VTNEIHERTEFLERMRELGQGAKYEAMIATEIHERVKAIHRIQQQQQAAER